MTMNVLALQTSFAYCIEAQSGRFAFQTQHPMAIINPPPPQTLQI